MRLFLRLAMSCVATLIMVPGASRAQDEPEPFTYTIGRKGTATIEDGYRVFVALAVEQGRLKLDGKTSPGELSFEELAAHLQALSVINPKWTYAPDQHLRRDVLAYMSASYMGVRPGLLTGVLGMTRRYAHREMLYRQVIAPGAPGTFVSGSELLSVAGRVARRTGPDRNVKLTEDEIH